MKKNLLFVSANRMNVPYPVYPLGISFLATYLRNKLPHFDIGIFDFIDKNNDEFVDALKNFKPDYICISLRNIDDVNLYKQESFINDYQSIVESARNASVSSVVIIGGSGFSIFPELLFRTLNPDYGIYGEGEECLYQLISALENKSDVSQIESLLFSKGDAVFFNKKKHFLKKLTLSFEPCLLHYYRRHSGMLNIQTKRGCPYKCIYCTYPLIEGGSVRTPDIGDIVNTLSGLSENNETDYVFFTDSIFNIHNDFNRELAESIIRKNIRINWGAYFNFCNLDEKMLQLFKRSGLKHIEFGTDSLCDTLLKKYNKPFTVSDIFEVSKICVKLGIDYANFLILGGYGETDDTLNETFENSKKIDMTVFFPFIGMRIYPGTQLCKMALKENKIDRTNNLLKPVYYISDKIDMATLKEKAHKTGKKWVFPDDDFSEVTAKLRLKNKKGPLWEYLLQ